MKKTFLISIGSLFLAAAGIVLTQHRTPDYRFTQAQIENLEALSDPEGPEDLEDPDDHGDVDNPKDPDSGKLVPCCNTITKDDYSSVRYCGTCTMIPGAKAWISGTDKCLVK